MTPRLKKAIAKTAEFSGSSEDEVADMAAIGLERGLEQAEKQVRSKLKSAIKRSVTFGAGVRRGGRSRRAGKTAAVAA